MRREAGIYVRKNEVIVHSYSQTTSGAWIASEPFIRIPRDPAPNEPGEAIRKALAASDAGVDHPTEFGELLRPAYELAGVKSWSAFARGAQYCVVRETDGSISIEPHRRERSGFNVCLDRAKEVMGEELDDDALGVAVVEVMSLSSRAGSSKT